MADRSLSGRIFISYRREDSAAVAGRLQDQLQGQIPSASVFIDVDSITLGSDFSKSIEAAVASCDVLLAIIGPRWLNAEDDHRVRRLGQRNDYVTMEISAGLGRGIPVIPVLVDGAALPRQADLPTR